MRVSDEASRSDDRAITVLNKNAVCILIYMNFGCYHEVDGVDSCVVWFFTPSFFSFFLFFFPSLAFSSNRLGVFFFFFFVLGFVTYLVLLVFLALCCILLSLSILHSSGVGFHFNPIYFYSHRIGYTIDY